LLILYCFAVVVSLHSANLDSSPAKGTEVDGYMFRDEPGRLRMRRVEIDFAARGRGAILRPEPQQATPLPLHLNTADSDANDSINHERTVDSTIEDFHGGYSPW